MDPTQGHATENGAGLTPEQLEAEEDAAFEAGFATVSGSTPPAGAATSQDDDVIDVKAKEVTGTAPQDGAQPNAEQDAAAAAAAAAAEAERKAQEEANAPVTITKAQLDRLMAITNDVPTLREQITRTHDTVAGKLGSLQQTVKTLQEKAGRGNAASIKQLKRLEAEFPELAQALTEDLNENYSTSQAEDDQHDDDAAQSNAEPVNPLESPQVQEVLRAKEVEITEAVVPGFREMARTPEFQQWTATLPAAAVDLLNSSWDSKIMIPAFKDFKKWKEQKEQTARSGAATKQQNHKRLERAVAPTDGAARSGNHVVDEDAEFEAGFNKVRRAS